ncbi:tRNA pseudouridine(13) synthase TruD [Natronospira bacteriovora]|uniref:tRNA pseudouridine synthase D n=1 Tax=Natronospira bacteriovora TaxID=3069753 RepID=A0ABU0W4D0_9GAMM|nr:tRNA pseudouridine(13) synthase TruD [Natronospira sp. AB-CW4]MDQ2068320.1 tRNA pseudouridine(13) synthase TruD [Natronospira sp. AB-CW4]
MTIDYRYSEDALPRAHGGPAGSGLIRATVADFRVDEVLGFDPDDDGDHWLLHVEKRNANTHWVARQLASAAGVGVRDVGQAGLKDRRAVARQWFSVPVTGSSSPRDWRLEDARILAVHRHRRKLRTGSLKGNRFLLVVRDLDVDSAELDKRLARVASHGVPNYFGPQRFGRDGDNVEQLLRGRLPRRGNRRSLLLSAGRSWLFNQVLAERVRSGTWHQVMAGDRMILDGSRSHFAADMVDEELVRRCRIGDIHPSGPLWGGGETPASADVAALETAAAHGAPALLECLTRARLEHDRRPLRLKVSDLLWSSTTDTLQLSFQLPAGAFATAVLRELIDFRKNGDSEDD